MKITLDEVKAAFPEFFPAQSFGHYCEDGWAGIIWKLCFIIKHRTKTIYLQRKVPSEKGHSHEKLPDGLFTFVFDQIKEKFGTGRFYYTNYWPPFNDLPVDVQELFDADEYQRSMLGMHNQIIGAVSMAEAMTSITCEFSGEPGALCVGKDGGGWVKTMSPAVAESRGYIEQLTAD